MLSNKMSNLYKTIIMEHYKNPRNKGNLEQDGYISCHLKNPTCGDDIRVAVKLVDEVIADIRHEGIGCSICCSSASVMSCVLKNKCLADMDLIVNNFYELVQGNPIEKNINMGDAVAYSGVSMFPARIKCATIPWKALEQAVLESKEE